MYTFIEQFDKGQKVEESIFNHLRGRGWQVVPSIYDPMRKVGQRLGFDATIAKTPHRFKLEIKADFASAKTKNFFIETVSVDKINAPGWAISSRADIIALVIPDARRIFLASLKWLRSQLGRWAEICKTKKCHNKNSDWRGEFFSEGLLVPVAWFETEAQQRTGTVRILDY